MAGGKRTSPPPRPPAPRVMLHRRPASPCCACLPAPAAARPPAVGWARSGLLVLLAVSGHYPHHGKCLVFGIDWCKRPTDC